MSFKTMIIDDESLARERLKALLEDNDFIDIIACAKNGIEAVELINEKKPDLIFLDIQMPGLNGFEVLQKLDKLPYIIFATAYDEYALKAFETNSIDYLLKPIEKERLSKSIEKLRALTGNGGGNQDFNEKIKNLISSLSSNKLEYINVKINDEIIFLRVEEVVYLRAEGKYTIVATEKEEHMINESISSFEDNLPDYFKRIHRSYIVNFKYIKKIKKWFGGKYKVVVKNLDIELPVSKNYKDNLF